MRWQVDVHDGERAGGGDAVGQDGAVESACHGEDDGQHDDQAGVEEDGKAHQKGGYAEGEGGALFTEAGDEGFGEAFCTAGGFDQPAEHCSEADEEGN